MKICFECGLNKDYCTCKEFEKKVDDVIKEQVNFDKMKRKNRRQEKIRHRRDDD